MPTYKIAEQIISSDFEISYLPEHNEDLSKIDIVLKTEELSLPNISPYYNWLNEDLSPRLIFFKDSDNFYLEYPKLIKFKICKNIIFCEEKVSSKYYFLHLLTDQIIPLFLSLDKLILHASAYNYQNHNIILSGQSGSGKSTFVKNLYKFGKFIADDFTVIQNINEKKVVIPSYPGIRLIRPEGGKEVYQIHQETFYKPQSSFKNIIVCLNREATIPPNKYYLTLPHSEEVYQTLLKEIILLNVKDPINQLTVFSKLNSLVQQSKLLKLTYSDLSQIDFNILNQDFLKISSSDA